MKVYRSITIDIDTLEVMKEDSFEYNGDVCECKGGGDSKVEYSQSPAQAKVYKALYPQLRNIWSMGGDSFAQSLGLDSYMLPTQGYYDNMPREMKAAMWEPYNEGANQLKEQMGYTGTLGSPRAGYSGAMGAALGEYYADATNDIALNAWNMGSGYRNAYYNAQMFPYTSALGALGGTYGNAVVDPGTMNNTGASVASGMIGGGLTGYQIGATYGSAGGPYGAAIGAVAGGLLGYLGS